MPNQPTCKIRGDAGTYEVWSIDWLNRKYLVFRASEYQWISADKVKLITGN
jgi:Uma2 family endonuclease